MSSGWVLTAAMACSRVEEPRPTSIAGVEPPPLSSRTLNIVIFLPVPLEVALVHRIGKSRLVSSIIEIPMRR